MSDGGPDHGEQMLASSPLAGALIARCREAGLSLQGIYLVGGAVRDAALGLPARDLDLAVEGDGLARAHLLAAALDGSVVAEHRFGTAELVAGMPGVAGPVRIDVATCRAEAYPEPGALPTVQVGVAIETDLARRDFGINAIALSLDDGEHAGRVVDPAGGLVDLDARRVRVLHDDSFRDDPTRIVRAARYATRLAMLVDEATTAQAISAVRDGALGTVSADRLRAEIELVLTEPAWRTLRLLHTWGVLDQLDPRLAGALAEGGLLHGIDLACGMDRERHATARRLRLAVLAAQLEEEAAGWLAWMGFSAAARDEVLGHIAALTAVRSHPDALRDQPPSRLYPVLGELRDSTAALLLLAVAGTDPALAITLERFRQAVRDTRLHVRGDDVMALGMPAGRGVGEVLGELFLRALDGEFADEAAEREALGEAVAARRAAGEGADG